MAERVVVVGGGLAGLSAAARLAHEGCAVTLLEKAPKLGGRAITIPLKGFNFNFGAHAIYGRDRSFLRRYERELGLRIDWRPFSPSKASYDLGTFTTPMPVTLDGLLRTRILDPESKLRFTWEIAKTVADLERGEPGVPIGEHLQKQPEALRRLFLLLGSHNFFTNEPERIPSPTFYDYYQRLFTTMWPVSYIGGGWQSIVDGLEGILTRHGGQVVTRERVQGVTFDGNRVTTVHGKEGSYAADAVVFCIPPKELVGVFADTPFLELFDTYNRYFANEVVVYDVGLSQRIASPYTYIYDVGEQVFITDISYYDQTCTPPGGQLMQAVAYMTAAEHEAGLGEARIGTIEAVYDRHFPGWRDVLAAKRVSKRATVQEIKHIDDQRPLPTKLYSLANAYFAGDWCEGEGQLSELSFSSAYRVVDRILAQRSSGTLRAAAA